MAPERQSASDVDPGGTGSRDVEGRSVTTRLVDVGGSGRKPSKEPVTTTWTSDGVREPDSNCTGAVGPGVYTSSPPPKATVRRFGFSTTQFTPGPALVIWMSPAGAPRTALTATSDGSVEQTNASLTATAASPSAGTPPSFDR